MAVAITEESRGNPLSLQSSWHRTAPPQVVKRYRKKNSTGAWKVWRRHLAERKSPEAPAFLTGSNPPLLWGWPADWHASLLRDALASPEVLVGSAIADRHAAAPGPPRALELLAAAYALPELARHAPAETWWQVTTRLHALVEEAQQQRVDWPADPNEVLQQQLLAGELPLALGYLFPEICALRSLRKTARAIFSEALLELTDGEGMPHARLLPVLGPLLACWTRARWLGERLSKSAWSPEAEHQYQWLVRHAIRLADADGRFLLTLSDEPHSAWNRAMFSTALDLAGNNRDCAAARAALGNCAVPKRLSASLRRPPKPSVDSEWSGITVMADGWAPTDGCLAVAYADDPIQLVLSVRGKRLLAGRWTFETVCDGNPVQAAGEWENLFWSSEKSYDMLELGIRLTEGLRLERQILFARHDQVLYLADVVISADDSPRHLQHSFQLPMADGAHWQPEAETRDGVLHAGKARATFLPLALPEWRTDPRGGSLIEAHGGLALTQQAEGRALYCPLFIDLKPARAKHERTWRQLTVGEWMEVIPRDLAVGFRAQSGRDQWLFYRSIGLPGNRTVLGQNISGEFCAGRFHSTGKFDEWIEIEAV